MTEDILQKQNQIQNLNPTLGRHVSSSSYARRYISSSVYAMHASYSSYTIPSGRHWRREGRWGPVNPWPYRTVKNVTLISSSSMASCRRKFSFFLFFRKRTRKWFPRPWVRANRKFPFFSFLIFLPCWIFSSIMSSCRRSLSPPFSFVGFFCLQFFHIHLCGVMPPRVVTDFFSLFFLSLCLAREASVCLCL